MLCLRNREIGQISGNQVMKCYFQSKLSTMRLIYRAKLGIQNELENVEYIKGGKDYIYGIWTTTTQKNCNYVLGNIIKARLQRRNSTFHKIRNSHIQDIADDFWTSGNSYLYVENNGDGEAYLRWFWYPSYEYRRDINLNFKINSLSGPVFCIETGSSASGPEKLLLGGDSVTVFGILDSDGEIRGRNYNVDGRTMTVSFDNTKNIFLSGQSNGSVYIYDCRMPYPAYCTKPFNGSDTCIVDSLYVEHHQNEFTIAGVNNKLCTFDLRVMMPSVHFFGHTHALRKRPLSFANEFLCVNGGDNVVRIWHSSGGLPLHEIKPDFPANQQRGWLTLDGLKYELYLFEGQRLKVFQFE